MKREEARLKMLTIIHKCIDIESYEHYREINTQLTNMLDTVYKHSGFQIGK